MNKNNIMVFNPHVVKYFWKKIYEEHSHLGPTRLKRAFSEFVTENEDRINWVDEKIMSGDFLTLEKAGYKVNSQIITEGIYADSLREFNLITENRINEGLDRSRRRVRREEDEQEDIVDEITQHEDDIIGGEDDEDEALAKRIKNPNIKKRQPKATPTFIDVAGGVRNDTVYVKNFGSNSTSVHDLHVYCRAAYADMVEEGKCFAVDTPFALLDTSNCTEFDALFAFYTMPNADLSNFDMSFAKNVEGMFYKCDFNNDSIRDWDLRNAENTVNMFVGCTLRDESVIANWRDANNRSFVIASDMSSERISKINKDFKVIAGNWEELVKRKREKNIENNMTEKKYVLSTAEFINENYVKEGRIADFGKHIADKIQKAVHYVSMKTRDGIDFIFNTLGEFMPVITPNSSIKLINGGKAKGVQCNDSITYNTGRYGFIKKGDIEYDNFLKFLDLASVTSSSVTEARTPLASKAKVNVDGKTALANYIEVIDYDTIQLRDDLTKRIKNTIRYPHAKENKIVLCIWGAPGIGKSTIPESIINDLNGPYFGDSNRMMTLIKADCGLMNADSFSIPMPIRAESMLDRNPEVQRYIESGELSEEDVKTLTFQSSTDAPKTWLPMYKPARDNNEAIRNKKNELLDRLANGGTIEKNGQHYDTGMGGILMFDELLRARPDVLNIVMQIANDRKYNGYVLGSKWTMIICSNRPCDDAQIQQRWGQSSPVMGNRFKHCNFVPDFNDWKKWALSKGGFDQTTIDFIEEKPVDGDDSRWHNVDPDRFKSNISPLFPTPRSWSYCMADLRAEAIKVMEKKINTKKDDDWINAPTIDLNDIDISVLSESKFFDTAAGFLPEDLARDYTNYFFFNRAKFDYPFAKILSNEITSVSPEDKKNISASLMSKKWIDSIKNTYNKRNRLTPEQIIKLVQFLFDTYGENSENVINTFIDTVLNIIGIDSDMKDQETFEVYNDIILDWLDDHFEGGLYDDEADVYVPDF